MIYPAVKFEIDAMNMKDIRDIKNVFLCTEVDVVGVQDYYEEATKLMSSTDESELRYLFFSGIKLGIFLKTNENIIPKI